MKDIGFQIRHLGSKIVFWDDTMMISKSILLWILGEFAGGGFVAVAVGPSDR